MPANAARTTKQRLGQFFTVDPALQQLVRQLTTPGSGGGWLEPSAGGGDLATRRPDDGRPMVLAELDPTHVATLQHRFPHAQILPGCFFQAPIPAGSIGSAIGNPPYVAWTVYQHGASPALSAYLRQRGFGGKTNLVYPFLDRVAHLLAAGGEMIMVVPKDFSTATSAVPLRTYLATHGVFTHWVDCGETSHFPDAQLESLVVFRWTKTGPPLAGSPAPVQWADGVAAALAGHWERRQEVYSGHDRLLLMLPPRLTPLVGQGVLGDHFEILVGSVTGYDAAFRTPPALAHLPQAQAFQTGPGAPTSLLNTNGLVRLEDADPALQQHLLKHETALKARHGADPTQWWHWATVRNPRLSLAPTPARGRIYVCSQTRRDPFAVGARTGFAGSIYAMFPRNASLTDADLALAVRLLNSSAYRQLYQACGLGVRDKFRCAPRPLSMVPFPPPAAWAQLADQLARLP